MSYDYNPETDGLKGLGYADFQPDGCYEWDGVSVYVRESDKRFFWENGSGCSCNGPMEFVYSLNDFDSGTFAEFVTFLTGRLDEAMKCTYDTPRAKAEILSSVSEVLSEAVKYA
jgi:hypothetical protein